MCASEFVDGSRISKLEATSDARTQAVTLAPSSAGISMQRRVGRSLGTRDQLPETQYLVEASVVEHGIT